MGYTVSTWDLTDGLAGLTDTETREITLASGLTEPEARSTLAHELGHAHYGHGCSTPAFERRARTFAARVLIDPDKYARLERINPDVHWLAEEFTVTPRIVTDYEQFCLTRLEGVTYARARLGANQWTRRESA